MVTIDNVQAGVTAFVDREIVPSLSGWDRVIVAGGIALMISNLPNIIAQYASNPAVAALGVYDKDNGQVNVEALYNAACPYIGAERLPVKIPIVGITVKVGRPELDSLYRCIKEA